MGTLRCRRLPRCRFDNCDPAVLFIKTPEGCHDFPQDRKQWLCRQHFVRLLNEGVPYQVLADVVSLGWAP